MGQLGGPGLALALTKSDIKNNYRARAGHSKLGLGYSRCIHLRECIAVLIRDSMHERLPRVSHKTDYSLGTVAGCRCAGTSNKFNEGALCKTYSGYTGKGSEWLNGIWCYADTTTCADAKAQADNFSPPGYGPSKTACSSPNGVHDVTLRPYLIVTIAHRSGRSSGCSWVLESHADLSAARQSRSRAEIIAAQVASALCAAA